MQKEIITNSQALSILIFFIMGSTLILGAGGQALNDSWISIILAIVMAIPIVLVYARILNIYPGKDIYEILESIYGKTIGKLIILLYTWYAFHLGDLVIINIGEFVNTVAMPETPMIVPILFIGLLSIWGAKAGIEVLGRSAKLFIFFIFAILFIVQLLALPQVNFSYIKPILYNGFGPIFKGAFATFAYPFAEVVLFTAVFNSLKNSKSVYKVYISGLLIAGVTILIIGLRNLLTLGPNYLSHIYFPSYMAVSRIDVGNFIQRIEVTVSLTFMISGFIKISICLIAACKGIEKLFGLKNYRSVAVQVGLLMTFFAYIVYDSIMEMQDWAFNIYGIYAFPFQVILPVITLLIAEFKRRKQLKVKQLL